jgi:hypothetical protein
MSKLQVLIATYGQEGLLRIARMFHPVIDGVEYLVSCQGAPEPIPLPEKLRRPDFKVEFSPTSGAAHNRNLLLDRLTADYGLLSDDDISYSEEGLKGIIDILDENPDLDIATFIYLTDSGEPEKTYPLHPFDLTSPPPGFYISCVEVAFRKGSVLGRRIYFNENFGPGCKLFPCGEDSLWVNDALRRGLTGRFFPLQIAVHTGASTGLRMLADPGVLRSQGAVIPRLYPATGLLRVVLKALRVARMTDTGAMRCLKPALSGWWLGLTKKRVIFNAPRPGKHSL